MALIIEYEDPDLGFVDITGYVKWGEGGIRLTMTAEQGTVNTDSITVQDPDGIFNFVGLRNFSVKESESEFERIYIGWVWVKHVSRGDYYRTGPGRVWELELQDINHRLYQNVMAGNDTARPAETDVERIQWLLTTGEASGFTDTTTYVFTDRPVDMDANPDPGYNGQMFNQVMDDCAQQSGKNYYVIDIFDDYLGYKLGIWYGHDDLDEFVSEATISNVLSEVDNVSVFWADVAAKLDRDPSRVYSGVFANFDGGWTYRQRAQTVLDFVHRDTVANWSNVKTTAKANARADRMLNDLAADGEEDAVTVNIYSMLPSQANIFRVGHRVNGVKFTHFPGWAEGVDVRIVRKTITDQSEQFYSMELDLLPITRTQAPTCSAVVGDALTYDSGWIHLGAPHDHSSGPISQVLSLSPTEASVIVAIMATQESSFQPGPFVSCAAPFTLLGTGGTDLAFAGYQANTMTPGTFGGNFTGGDINDIATVAVALPTAAASPVQTAQGDTFSSVTLPSPPTPGNLLVMASYNLRGDVGTVSDFTPLVSEPNPGGANGIGIQIAVRCVQVGDDATFSIPGGAFAHNSWLSEWTIE